MGISFQINDNFFEEIFIKYKDRLFQVAYRFLRDYYEAEDATAETFALAYKNLKKFKQKSNIYTWLFKILLNVCWHKTHPPKKRSSSKVVSLEEADVNQISEQVDVVEELDRKERIDDVKKAINSLSNKYRRIIILREFYGLSYQEISVKMGIPLGTVMSTLHKARKCLKEMLERKYGNS